MTEVSNVYCVMNEFKLNYWKSVIWGKIQTLKITFSLMLGRTQPYLNTQSGDILAPFFSLWPHVVYVCDRRVKENMPTVTILYFGLSSTYACLLSSPLCPSTSVSILWCSLWRSGTISPISAMSRKQSPLLWVGPEWSGAKWGRGGENVPFVAPLPHSLYLSISCLPPYTHPC